MTEDLFGVYDLPKPYENELWYSVIARYHRHSGNTRAATTRQELFGKNTASLNVLSIEGMVGSSLKDMMRVVELHTVEPYLLRYFGKERKQEILSTLVQGGVVTNRPGMEGGRNRKLRYCPLCNQEDEQRYGEMFWHREHQIENMPCCPHHGCRLCDASVNIQQCNYHFYASDLIICPETAPDYSVPEAEKRLARYLMESLVHPFSADSDISLRALRDACQRNNVIRLEKSGMVCRSDELFAELCSTYGEELVGRYYTRESLKRNLRRGILSRTFTSTGPLMLIAAYYEIPFLELFCNAGAENDEREINLRRIQQIQSMSQSGYTWSIHSAAKQVGVSLSEFRVLVEKAGVAPFWQAPVPGKGGKGGHVVPQFSVKAYVTQEEKDAIRARAEELGMANVAEYIRYCIRLEHEQKGAIFPFDSFGS